jgi:septal ring factor EnvC (AmiA/AmiB activator)
MTGNLDQRVTKIEGDMEEVRRLLQETARSQATTQQQLDALGQRVDSFVFEAQRLFTQEAERLNRLEPQIERAEAIIQRLDRNYTEQQAQLAEFRLTTNAALERIDRVLDYLMRQTGSES